MLIIFLKSRSYTTKETGRVYSFVDAITKTESTTSYKVEEMDGVGLVVRITETKVETTAKLSSTELQSIKETTTTTGLRNLPIPDFVVKEAIETYPKNWKEYLEIN